MVYIKDIFKEKKKDLGSQGGPRKSPCVHAPSLQSCPTLCNPMDHSPQAALSMEFSRQVEWVAVPSSRRSF